jgi:hypothetical protein
MRKERCWKNAAELQELCRFELNITPAWMTVSVEAIVGVCDPSSVESGKHSNVLTAQTREKMEKFRKIVSKFSVEVFMPTQNSKQKTYSKLKKLL